MNKTMIEIGALWRFKSGSDGFGGSLGKGRLVVLPNKFKKPGDSQPDYRVFIAENEERKNPYAGQATEVGPTPTVTYNKPFVPNITEEDLPF